jgi:hypothetical protein
MAADDKEIYEAGRLSGIAEEHLRTLQQELIDLRGGQASIVRKMDELKERLEQLNNWRWFVLGIASVLAFLISLVMGFIKGLFKP